MRRCLPRHQERYPVRVLKRFILAWSAPLMVGGCMAQLPPASQAARTPTPQSVTRDNPAGDADSPADAALERLLNSKVGHKEDKFETLDVPLPDRKNWKRIRFFGYPTRAGFRYGKDPTYAASVILYSETDDDSPISCIEAFATKAQRTADLFDLEVGEMKRSLDEHRKGVEAVDWPAWEAEWEERERQRISKVKQARAERKKRRAEMRKRMLERRKIRIAEARKRRAEAQERAKQAKANPSKKPTTPGEGNDAAIAPDPKETPKATADAKNKPRRTRLRLPHFKALKRFANRKRSKRPPRKDRALEVRPAPLPPELEPGHMAVIRTSGQFETLFDRDRYLGAVVAYESWPGTCLVQGFAVKMGTDDELAAKVVLDEGQPGNAMLGVDRPAGHPASHM